MNTPSDNRLRQILEFWHKVEFFIPFDLRGQVLQAGDAESNVKRITVAELHALAPNASGDLWQVAKVPKGKQVLGFDLYLGVFDRGYLATVTNNAIGETTSEETEIDQEERGDLEGETCFAKVRLNALGEPQFDQVSVSTVPWALGCVLDDGIGSLSFDAFQVSLKQLQEDLQNFQVRRSKATEASKYPQKDLPLTRTDVEKLLEVFYTWARFEPDKSESTLAVVRAIIGKRPAPSAKPDNGSASKSAADGELPESDDDESETSSSAEAEIDILNSFYVKDIERAIFSIQQGQTVPTLEAYLTPLHEKNRIDLYSPPGHQRIISDLHPVNTPQAHWLDEPNHAMSLMQQFAINNVFSALSTSGLFSVNGPPGTGKTTLLRDIFAENITRRARILAGCGSAKDAFQAGPKPTVQFEGKSNSWSIALLRPELTGFEMIVASSNNAAVNNISEDLPKAKSLGSIEWTSPTEIAWRTKDGAPKQTYLQSVAIRMATQTSRGEFAHLEPDDTPWGLISCALGKRANRRKFVERFSFPVIKKNQLKEAPKPKGYDPDRHQSFWEWRDQYQDKGPSFSDAKAAFVALDKKVCARKEQLARLALLTSELAGHTEATYSFAETQLLSTARATINLEQTKLANIDKALCTCLELLSTLKEDEKLIPVPSRWTQLFGKIPSTRFWKNPSREKCHKYQDELSQNREAQRKYLQEKLCLGPQKTTAELSVDQARAAVDTAARSLQARVAEWRTKDAERNDLHSRFRKAAIPEFAGALEDPQWQKDGIWCDNELNELRSKLFAAALGLHEAWLAEVTVKGGGFSPNIYAVCDLLQGQRLETPEHALALWQSLFMVVPVASSTFASIASQFKELGANTLGWLFIDEAGQAVPQAAVGALWRAKRAVVVGDPLQIEPVFTVPIKLIEALAKSSHLPEGINVTPHTVSVQNLADAANSCGAWLPGLGDEPQWIGSPLRVHRRCVDPMFRIANAIAYENKMVFGLKSSTPPADGYDLGASAWVHVSGVAHSRHVVPAQIALVTKAVMSIYQSKGKLPPLYIISPFKRIKRALIESLSDMKAWKEQGITTLSKDDLGKWCQASIGTVHTFQGKEEHIVWMVLGCDKRGAGAVSWAASKPNILNVALTRAKRRFFMIGDMDLWGDKRYLHTAKLNLPEITQAEFLSRCSFESSQLAPEGQSPAGLGAKATT
ncbi:AAA domain-containing protein [Laribacter hongkongensis]|uniref:DEAD/DEAH box helicase n=1 Tax=Laribacter hongkongensis TaxID=168471 RepID=UPI001EFE791E|nr:AAA domain-containing protein [Laribacter hongkongensis]MCG8996076.1 AAA domain-containing protein [Laribacter hongkongensis]MCG9010995.1 AAA domain-containing protein [Laribacter hongkongensis]MCG9023431.1 AAA domain-containing protein [Laribacter hongkongensis]MCG9047809.1 AAA domain-containing protein [Laribacter hongkongensis]MCG9074835.1 AAA domain-containing protein [Laribacter hongkongensis]